MTVTSVGYCSICMYQAQSKYHYKLHCQTKSHANANVIILEKGIDWWKEYRTKRTDGRKPKKSTDRRLIEIDVNL